jgi:hypothetical protein
VEAGEKGGTSATDVLLFFSWSTEEVSGKSRERLVL